MLRDKIISVSISYRNITHYLKLGYNAILNQVLDINIEHLPTSSHIKVFAICEICSSSNSLIYHKYIVNKKRHGFYGCRGCSRQKAGLTSINRYGVDNYSRTDEFKKRIEITNINKFGYKTNLISPDYKDIIKNRLKEKYGTDKFYEINRKTSERKDKVVFKWCDRLDDIIKNSPMLLLSEDLYDDNNINNDYFLYRNECRRISVKNVKILFNSWSGFDYYDSTDISKNFNLDHNHVDYPTIDHKISIYYGFKNKISFEEISDINNLCITKRSINSKKRNLNEKEFIESLKSTSSLV